MLLLEVLDKMPPAIQVSGVGIATGLIGFMAIRRWRRAAFGVLPLAVLVAWSGAAIYTDPYVGGAVWREGGWPYATSVALGATFALVLPVLGFLRGTRPSDRGRGAA